MQPYFDVRDRNNGKPYVAISLIDLLEMPEVYADKISDAYILIGESGDVIHDRFVSPATNEYRAGVYSHAFLLDAILQDKLLFKMHGDSSFALWIVLTIISVVVYFFIPKFFSPIFALASIVTIIFLTRWAYDAWRVVIDILPLLLASSLLTYPATYIYKYFIVDRDKRVIVNTFSRYLSPSVVKMIDANSIEASLGGEKKELSILFSDIAGFTSIAEKMDTKDLFELMTKYLSKMTDILTDEHGTLDKYIGDAIMGFFGAPVDDPLHSIHACRTAIRMRKTLAEINAELIPYNIGSLDFRVGIATGEVMVGNIGSEKRFNYTVLGDAVNLASRLEAIGKEYGVHIIIAASTRLIIDDEFLLRELDYIAVKGKDAGTRIYELIDTRDSGTDMSLYATYESALRLYREGKYLEA